MSVAGAALNWTWLVGAVALAGYLIARRRAHGRLTLAAGGLAAAVAAAVGLGLVRLPNLEETIVRVGEALGPWTYGLVGALAFLETGAFVGLIAPGETTVIVGGLVAGQGHISLALLIAVVWACAVGGDLTSYALGRRLGREFLLRHGEPLKITEERLQQVEGFFERHGGATITIGRFIGLVRPLAPFVAGTTRMPLERFLPYDVLGAGAWSATFCVLGYVFWRSFHQLTTYVSRGLFALGSVVAVGVGIWALVQLRRDPERRRQVRAWLAEREQRRGWRPLVRAAGPLWRGVGRPTAVGAEEAARFWWERLTPGGLGLELTTMLALLSVAGFGFALIGDELGHGALARADDVAASVAGRLRTPVLVDAAKAVTALGAATVVAVPALATTVAAAARRRIEDAAALACGTVASYVAADVAAAAYDRPRPAGSLVEAAGSAYPSAHALYAVTLVACAVVLVRAGTGWAVRFAAVFVALALVAAVAVTRVYLGAEQLTDAIGGVALGVAVWSLVGCGAVLVAHVRHNGARTP